MITGIDHIVIAVHSLSAAMATYQKLGFTVIDGGRHPYGSHNALIGFADGSYIELLAFYEDSPAHPWWDLLHERGGGLVDFCMATDAIRDDWRVLKDAGAEVDTLAEGGRARPDGYQVRWINNKVGGAWQGLIPFLIEDVTPRHERLPAETDHPNGVSGIHTLRLAAPDTEATVAVMRAALGQAGQAVADESLSAAGVSFEVGGHRLEYLSPQSADSPVAAHLAANRPPAYSVTFRTSGPAMTFTPDISEGVCISLAPV